MRDGSPERRDYPLVSDRVIGPLRNARQPLFDGLRRVQHAAISVQADAPGCAEALALALDYLAHEFMPNSRAEEFTLYPAVDGVVGSRGATDVMAVQHGAIGEMVEDLMKVVGAASESGSIATYARLMVPLLHGLYAAIRTHLEAEDAVYLALLDEHLSESQVRVIVENLERVSAGSAAPR